MYWGEIPVIDMNRTDELGLGRQPLKTVWEYIFNDFITATNNLPNPRRRRKTRRPIPECSYAV